MAKKPYPVPETLKQKVAVFQAADSAFKAAWESFATRNAQELAYLDQLRESRNALVTEIKNDLREESAHIDPEVYGKTLVIGPFTVQKGESYWYVPELFIEMVREVGMYDRARDAGCIIEKVDIDKKKAEDFCAKNDIGSRLERCKDSKETTPAVKGVKRIADFCAEVD